MNPQQFILEYSINVDTVTFRFGDCFTKSFASYPMFGVDFNDDVKVNVKVKKLPASKEAEIQSSSLDEQTPVKKSRAKKNTR